MAKQVKCVIGNFKFKKRLERALNWDRSHESQKSKVLPSSHAENYELMG